MFLILLANDCPELGNGWFVDVGTQHWPCQHIIGQTLTQYKANIGFIKNTLIHHKFVIWKSAVNDW